MPVRRHGPRRALGTDYAMFAEALAALILAAVTVKFPFRVVGRSMSLNRGASLEDAQLAAAVARAVDRAARRVPWRSVCLDQGLAAHWMLRRRGQRSLLHYGIGKAGERLAAHVWVSLGDQI